MSTPAAVRAAAARVVAQVAREHRSLDAALGEAGSFAGSELALVRLLSYGTVRWYLRLRALLERLSARPARTLEPVIESLALVGLYQLLDTDVAPHAAVSETVEAARLLGRPKATGLINAVLRRAQREAPPLLDLIDADPALRTSQPRWLVRQLATDWADELETLLDANNGHPPFWLRVNRRRIDLPECLGRLAAAGHEVTRSDYAPEAVRLAKAVDVSQLPEFASGLVSVQDAAAQLAAHLLAVPPGARVLDACAAPGGKTCHVLELAPELAELVAVDASGDRLERVGQNLERLGLEARLVVGDSAQPEGWWDGRNFDRVLLDVPCSATGVIRRHPDVKLLRRPGDIAELSRRQAAMLRALWALLAPGGRLLYASCSALHAENGAVVSNFLAQVPQARDVTPVIPGLGRRAVGFAIRAGEAGMDGFYYACLEKSSG